MGNKISKESSSKQSIVALTVGDPSSITTFITLKAWQELKNTNAVFFLIANKSFIEEAIQYFNLDIKTYKLNSLAECKEVFLDYLPIWDIEFNNNKSVANFLGVRDVKNVPYTIDSINKATQMALENKINAIVTNPIDKDLVNQYMKNLLPHKFIGHTEYLAEKCNVTNPVMMMATPLNKLKVIPITIHVSLKQAIASLNEEKIITTALIANEYLSRYFNIKNPKMVITGLNPHSGENGLMGDEEEKIIIPAIKYLERKGVNVIGPIPADTAFINDFSNKYDVILGMYHDQVLTPFKTLYFDDGVNVTLGLPFIRTSPDHGTAFNLAKESSASPKSLIAAIKMACSINNGY